MGGNATSGPTGLIQLALPLEGILGYALQKVRTKERMEYAEKTTTDFACFINALPIARSEAATDWSLLNAV